MNSDKWCKHYNGLHNGLRCPAGVLMDDIIDRSVVPHQWACCHPETVHCEKYEAESPDVIEERNRQLIAHMARMTALGNGTSDVCPHCGKQLTAMRQVGRCVYGSCGCRLWQGRVPKTWQDKA